MRLEDGFSGGPKENSKPDNEELLLKMRSKAALKRLEEHLVGQDPEIIAVAMALASVRSFYAVSRAVNEECDELSAESEALIESPDAKTLEVKIKRRAIADKINILLEQKEDLAQEEKRIREYEATIREASKDQIAQAEVLVKPITDELTSICAPGQESN